MDISLIDGATGHWSCSYC